MPAKFVGAVKTIWLRDSDGDRNMELLEDFLFVDEDGKEWPAPKGSIINGASIPPAFWTPVGPPYVGDYRRASVIHDVACERRTEPSEAVHLMFYEAMRVDGAGFVKANTMYQAVKRFGPSWDINNPAVLESITVPPTEEDAKRLIQAVEEAAAKAGKDASPIEVEKHIGF